MHRIAPRLRVQALRERGARGERRCPSTLKSSINSVPSRRFVAHYEELVSNDRGTQSPHHAPCHDTIGVRLQNYSSSSPHSLPPSHLPLSLIHTLIHTHTHTHSYTHTHTSQPAARAARATAAGCPHLPRGAAHRRPRPTARPPTTPTATTPTPHCFHRRCRPPPRLLVASTAPRRRARPAWRRARRRARPDVVQPRLILFRPRVR